MTGAGFAGIVVVEGPDTALPITSNGIRVIAKRKDGPETCVRGGSPDLEGTNKSVDVLGMFSSSPMSRVPAPISFP